MAFELIRKWLSAPSVTDRRGPTGNADLLRGGLFELSCVCAVTDRPYALQYARNARGKMEFRRAIKRFATAGENGGGSASHPLSWSTDAFASLTFPCPWCGADGIIHCCACGSLVCWGRTQGERFHCRESCGQSAITCEMRTVTGKTRSDARPPGPALPRASRDQLLLGPGKAIAKR